MVFNDTDGDRNRLEMDDDQLAWYDDVTGECVHRGPLLWRKQEGKLTSGRVRTVPDAIGRQALEQAWNVGRLI